MANSNLYVAISDITGEELGGFRTHAAAMAAAQAFDTPARKAAFTKRQTGAAKAAGAKAAATRAARREPVRSATKAAPARTSAPASVSLRGWIKATPKDAARAIAKSGARLAIYRLV